MGYHGEIRKEGLGYISDGSGKRQSQSSTDPSGFPLYRLACQEADFVRSETSHLPGSPEVIGTGVFTAMEINSAKSDFARREVRETMQTTSNATSNTTSVVTTSGTPQSQHTATEYPDEKYKAVIADLCAGKSMMEAAKAHKVDLTTVALWSRENQPLIDSVRADLLKDTMVIYTMKAFQAGIVVLDEVITNPKFRKDQSASGLMGIVSGSMDKSLMLLTALNRNPGATSPGPTSPSATPPGSVSSAAHSPSDTPPIQMIEQAET